MVSNKEREGLWCQKCRIPITHFLYFFCVVHGVQINEVEVLHAEEKKMALAFLGSLAFRCFGIVYNLWTYVPRTHSLCIDFFIIVSHSSVSGCDQRAMSQLTVRIRSFDRCHISYSFRINDSPLRCTFCPFQL